MKQVFTLLLLGLLIVSCKTETPTEIEMVSPEEMQELTKMEDVQLVDIRTPIEFEEGYINGFQNIDYFSDTFDQDIQKLDKTKPVIVVCRSGKRSAKCSRKMVKAGFVKIYDLDGGLTKWKHEGFEVHTIDIP
ncbi:MAG: rhodanese-like domain-containing protein [Flavobacteriaceae bacterium]|nr:rhodanese-like domain-containing protein [Bacteroidia bacterium]MBT8289073.1 rhodanese-like domain-containing protein [Bacteroidia bacterium]NNF74982.1 rhodanese-like domain-containing protein [Flavobacteriaceae bacterium]NNK71716.1 rhodanese-like domain-containing protein [Flavobacteriaceae bacterium]